MTLMDMTEYNQFQGVMTPPQFLCEMPAALVTRKVDGVHVVFWGTMGQRDIRI